jgi:phenylpyruvate tautomerase PptA (4-oxalocrotonate tautomerase family)
MPLVKIETQEGKTTETKRGLLDAVHEALVEAFEIPDDDRQQRIQEYPVDDFEVPPSKSANHVVVTIDAFPGRSAGAKRELYAGIVRRFADLGVDPLDVLIVVNEIPLENWGIRGGQSAADVDLGFALDV